MLNDLWQEFLFAIQEQPNETRETRIALWITRIGLVMFVILSLVLLLGLLC